jgi:5-methylcytosine-specific restriction protein B
MQPDSSLFNGLDIDGISIAALLDTLNSRIAVLFDREHTIGHSYLLPLRDTPTLDKLAERFEGKLLPLLQEYFYDDYEKIHLVLGDNQKTDDSTKFIIRKNDAVELFGNADVDFPEYYEINPGAFRRKEAYEFLQ